jgi:hypothetical protein
MGQVYLHIQNSGILWFQPVFYYVHSVGCHDGFGMELHTPDVILFMTDSHDQPFFINTGYFKAFRQVTRIDDPGMIAASLEFAGYVNE